MARDWLAARIYDGGHWCRHVREVGKRLYEQHIYHIYEGLAYSIERKDLPVVSTFDIVISDNAYHSHHGEDAHHVPLFQGLPDAP